MSQATSGGWQMLHTYIHWKSHISSLVRLGEAKLLGRELIYDPYRFQNQVCKMRTWLVKGKVFIVAIRESTATGSRLDVTSRLNQAMWGERRTGRARGPKGPREGMAQVEGLYGKGKPMSWRLLEQGEELRGARMSTCSRCCPLDLCISRVLPHCCPHSFVVSVACHVRLLCRCA